MADELTAVVAGGGIAGLASAIALRQAGWRVTVLERAPEFGEVGAGLGFGSYAMASLAALGVEKEVRDAGCFAPHAGYQDSSGRWLLRIPGDGPAAELASVCGVHRQRLHEILRRKAETGGAHLITGAEVIAVRPGAPAADPAVVSWKDGGEEHERECGLVVAADGVRSTVRSLLFPGIRVRYSRSTSWRAVIPCTALNGLTEVWGPGAEFGAMPVSDSEVYWFGEFVSPEGTSFPDELAAAHDYFADWAPWIRDLIAATTADQIMRHDVYDIGTGCRSYASGRVVLAGDAAHAMLPTIGQGAATALEDGLCVGRLIGAPAADGAELSGAISSYDQVRRPRCRQLARQAELLGRFGFELGPGWRQSARNTLLRLVPVGPAFRLGARVVSWMPSG